MGRSDHERSADRPKDINQLGRRIVDLATRQKPEPTSGERRPKGACKQNPDRSQSA